MTKEAAGVLAAVVVGYHVLAAMADAETVHTNFIRYKARRTLPNLRRLLLAEGVFISDLGWLLG